MSHEGWSYEAAKKRAEEAEVKEGSANRAPAFKEVVDAEEERLAKEARNRGEKTDLGLLLPGLDRLKRIVAAIGEAGLRFA